MCKESGRGWPQLDDDEVIDYLVMEAVATKVAAEENEKHKDKKLHEWKADKKDLYAAIENANNN